MKKFLAVFFTMVFVLGLAATAFAIHSEIPAETQAMVAKGSTQVTLGGNVRTRAEIRDNTTDFDDNASDYRAAYDARVQLIADIMVSDSSMGKISLESNWTYGEGGGDEAQGPYSEGNQRVDAIDLLEGWLLWKSGMYGLKVGHMPLALGNKLFFDHTKSGDDAIVFFADPNENLHIAVLTAKFQEDSATTNDDADAYVALFAYKGDGFNMSGDITLVHDNMWEDGGDVEIDMYNIGLRGDASFGAIKLMADVEIQAGEIKDANSDFKGFAFLAGADYNMGGTTLGVEFGYGSGPEDGSNDVDLFVTSLTPTIYQGYLYAYRIGGVCGGNSGICGLTYVKGDFSTKISDSLSMGAAVLWLTATEAVNDEDEIGIEVDWKVSYKLAKNLKWWFEGGYLFNGDYFSAANGVGTDDAYALRQGISLSF